MVSISENYLFLLNDSSLFEKHYYIRYLYIIRTFKLDDDWIRSWHREVPPASIALSVRQRIQRTRHNAFNIEHSTAAAST